jgi:4-hydroxybutyryl-CoA dehydratase/vinylacetyl-CoA-Delta-isomerase
MHGAGSPQAQRIMISRRINLKKTQKVAKQLCGVEKGDQLN